MNTTNFTVTSNPATKTTTYSVTIDERDLALLNLSEFDRYQLNSPTSKQTPIADRLLDLELIVRRIEENQPKSESIK